MLAWRLMSRCSEVLVAATTAAAASHYDALVGTGKIMHHCACGFVIDDRPNGNLQRDALALFARAVGTFTVAPALGFVFRIETEMHERVVALAGFHDDVATAAAI